MTKWKITHSSKEGAKWRFAEFGGPTGAESAGIVDLIAVRKNHKKVNGFSNRGDLLDLVLIQVKGGTASYPSEPDVDRLLALQKHHAAKAVVLVEWKRDKTLKFLELVDKKWQPLKHLSEVFG
jgi:hypothetical protein